MVIFDPWHCHCCCIVCLCSLLLSPVAAAATTPSLLWLVALVGPANGVTGACFCYLSCRARAWYLLAADAESVVVARCTCPCCLQLLQSQMLLLHALALAPVVACVVLLLLPPLLTGLPASPLSGVAEHGEHEGAHASGV